jgi:hypothetical protein
MERGSGASCGIHGTSSLAHPQQEYLLAAANGYRRNAFSAKKAGL